MAVSKKSCAVSLGKVFFDALNEILFDLKMPFKFFFWNFVLCIQC